MSNNIDDLNFFIEQATSNRDSYLEDRDKERRLRNLETKPRITAALSLIASANYRDFVLSRTGGKRSRSGLVMNFSGSVHEVTKRAAYSGSGDGLTSIDQRGIFGGGPGRTLFLQDLLAQGTTRSNFIPYAREIASWTNLADATLEGDDAPEQNFDLEPITASLGNAHVFFKTSEESFADYENLQSFLTQQLVRRIKLKIENLLLNSNGVAPNYIVGFQESGLPTVSIATAGSLLEAIEESIALIEANGYSPSFICLNPTDKRALYSASAVAGKLVWDGDTLRLHGVPILGSAAVTAGTGLVGDGSQATVFYHGGISGQAAYREESTQYNEDDFLSNLITVRAGARAALVIQSLGAFVEIVA